MEPLKLTLPDGSEKQVTSGTTGYDVALSISPRLAEAAIAVVLDKPGHRVAPLEADFVGFTCPALFVVGSKFPA